MKKSLKYDIGIIGGGPGGYVAAIRASQLGGRVVLFEQDTLGGVCLNRGCIPTKTLLKCASVYHEAKNAKMFGVSASNVAFDYGEMARRKDQVVATLISGIEGLMKSNRIDVVKEKATVLDSRHIRTDSDVYDVNAVVLATGSKPSKPAIKGIDAENVLDSDGFFAMKSLPASMVIVGGGVIGLEFGFLLSRLGCRVTILEMMETILPMADGDVICEVEKALKAAGAQIITLARVCEISPSKVIYEKCGKTATLEAEKVLVASGRVPNVDVEMLNRLGIRHEQGKIEVDDRMETNVPGIFAIGDVNGRMMLAHAASEEGIVAVENIFHKDRKIDFEKIPQCVYIHPEVAWVGLSEQEAIKQGHDVAVGRFPIYANGKSLTEGERNGFVKIVADKKHQEILGVHLVCTRATDMISEAALAMNLEATAGEMGNTVHPHPTQSEAIMEAANALLHKAINI